MPADITPAHVRALADTTDALWQCLHAERLASPLVPLPPLFRCASWEAYTAACDELRAARDDRDRAARAADAGNPL